MRTTNKSRREVIVERLRNKEYRDEYVSALISIGLPSQIREVRLARGWSQTKLASRARVHQSQISGFERKGCDSFTIATLLSLASAFDVGLKVRFVPFSELVHEDIHPERFDLTVPSFAEDAGLSEGDGPVPAFPIEHRWIYERADFHLPTIPPESPKLDPNMREMFREAVNA